MSDSLPDDLVPLPTQPFDVRPAEIPLTQEESRTALWYARGNVTEAAKILKVSSSRLRNFISKSDFLQREQKEARDMLLDIAESNVYDALTDDTDPGRKDSMTRYVLSQLGQERGYGAGSRGPINLGVAGKGRMVITWEDGTNIVADESNDNNSDDNIIDITPRAAE